jgi:tetratricopeptide (TPR) repeat protein
MKTNVIFLIISLIANLSNSQNVTLTTQKSINDIEVNAPKFCSGDKIIQGENYNTIDEFLSKNIVYPPASASCSTQGTELVRFTVTPRGELTNFCIINSVCKKMDEEVIKVLQLTNGMWQPACIDGKPVAMDKEVSVVFMIHPSSDFVAMAKSYLKQGNKLFFEKANPKKALKYYNMGINFLPNNETLLAARGLCKYELGDETGAISDWERLKMQNTKDVSGEEMENLAENAVKMRGYSEMMLALEK